MKVLSHKNYGSIPHLLGSKLGEHDKFITEGQHNIATKKSRDWKDTIWVTEKIGGSNVGVVKINGILNRVTRKGLLCSKSRFDTHKEFINESYRFLDRIKYEIEEGERLVFEWVDTENPCSIQYCHDEVFLLDWFDANNRRKPFCDVIRMAGHLGVSTPKIIHCGQPIDVKRLIKQKNALTSNLTKEQSEGLVYRVERNGQFDFMAKWVRPDFIPGKLLNKA